MKHKPVLLIFSGGLDTCFCAVELRRQGFSPIYTCTCDVGQPKKEIRQATRTAQKLGTLHTVLDGRAIFARDLILPALWAHASYGGYYLATALARPVIATLAARLAKKKNIRCLAHGCTGKGNDQFRLEYALKAQLPKATILAPVREQNLTRQEEIDALQGYGMKFPEKPYSIDTNLWGRSVEGEDLENLSCEAKEEIFQWTKVRKRKPTIVSLTFSKGIPTKINQKKFSLVNLIQKLNVISGAYGLGRADLIEDRILGMKSREIYEFPAASLLYYAHAQLESLVLTPEERHWKKVLSAPMADLLYRGLYYHPLFTAMKAFFSATQQSVTGEIALKLSPFQIKVSSRKSRFSLYQEKRISFSTKVFPQQEIQPLLEWYFLSGREAYGKKRKTP